MTRRGVGILGGTFDPIHEGHLRAAREVRRRLFLERVLLVPAGEPPHKSAGATAPVAPAHQRLAWARAAAEGIPGVEVDAIELEREGPSYSVDTVRAIAARIAPEIPVFVIGCDAFALFGTWRAPAVLLALAHFAIMTRPPGAEGSLFDWLPESVQGDLEIAADGLSARHRVAGTWIRTVEIPALDVSSSEIRARLRAGRSVRDLVPASVLDAVTSSGIYADIPAAAGALAK